MHKCPDCDQVFVAKSVLKRHLKLGKNCNQCNLCSEKFNTREEVLLHKKKDHISKCENCLKIFKFDSLLKKHLATCKASKTENIRKNAAKKTTERLCDVCGEKYKESYFSNHCKSLKHIDAALKVIEGESNNQYQCSVYETCFENNLIIYQIKNNNTEEFDVSALNILNNARHCVIKILKAELERKQCIKFRLGITGAFVNNSLQETVIDIDNHRKQFFSEFQLLLMSDDIESIIEDVSNTVRYS